MRHMQFHIDNRRIGQAGGEIMLLFAFHRGTPPVKFSGWQHFAGGQCVVHQRNSFVQRHGKNERLVSTLTRRLAGLRIGRDSNVMQEFLHQHLVFVPLHIDVADRISGKCTCSNISWSDQWWRYNTVLAFVNSLLTWLITTYNDLPLIPDRQMQLTSRNRIIFQYFYIQTELEFTVVVKTIFKIIKSLIQQ